MKIVAVTSCATGIAHSYMAAEAIKKAATKAGIAVRVEIQGAMGQEDKLRQEEIDAADAVLFANDVGIKDLRRFAGATARTVKVSPHEVIKHPDQIIVKLRELANGGTAS
jgi:fructose-specific phosphotransferase system IIB component